MEQLLHYCWKHKMFPLKPLTTTDGREVEVIDPGLPNPDAGPDFFNAKLKIEGVVWVGNVEIHTRSSNWFRHGHHHDAAYNNVVLHVVEEADTDVQTSRGDAPAQLILKIPEEVKANYGQLLAIDKYPPCHPVIPSLSRLMVHSWMSALQTERLEQKTSAICRRLEQCNGSWEAACFVTLARNYGFGVNGDAFETWAQNVPLLAVDHHRDNLFQIEAIFMGQAGLLDSATIPERYRKEAQQEGYFEKLKNEYHYLAHKFSLQPIDATVWKFLRLRPQNFPHIRIAQLASLYYRRKAGLSQLLECDTAEQLREALATGVTPYWETHYTFGSTSCKTEKNLSPASLDLLVINTAVPMLFAYGRHKAKEEWCERAFDLLRQVRAENNYIVRMWKQCGLDVENAGDSQALVQLKKEYCDRKNCLHCRIGYAYLQKSGTGG
ncbi:MAG: DUF2851 family protein [Prevotella sp.]|nr:DUF2851 family protein [Prevotella sp.]